MFAYDTPDTRAKYRSFKSRLTRLVNQKNHTQVIALWQEFESHYASRGWPVPDDWRRWERAAEDAQLALQRSAAPW